MVFIHMKYMIGRCQHHLLTLCKNHGLENIYHLCNIGHLNPVAVLIKDIQIDSGYNGISHGILLVEEARIRSRLYVKPVAPFIND